MVDSGKIDENDNSHHCFLGVSTIQCGRIVVWIGVVQGMHSRAESKAPDARHGKGIFGGVPTGTTKKIPGPVTKQVELLDRLITSR